MQELVLLRVQELRVEVYQTCTASKAAASKVAFGASTSQTAAPQDTLLGTATAPLTDLLTKPQACSHTALSTPSFCDSKKLASYQSGSFCETIKCYKESRR